MTNERKQRILCLLTDDSGNYYYNGPLDGIWGPESQEAYERFLGDFLTAEGEDKPKEETGSFWEEIEYFGPQEVACKCGTYCDGFPHEMQKLTMQIIDRARKHFGHPIVIISGLRCPQHNANVGGVKNSQHMFGEALDVYFYGVAPGTALAWLQSQPDVRYAYQITGSDNIHFDIQPVGR